MLGKICETGDLSRDRKVTGQSRRKAVPVVHSMEFNRVFHITCEIFHENSMEFSRNEIPWSIPHGIPRSFHGKFYM